MQEQAINIRFRDGSVYQSAPTDRTGFVPFEEVFPFFSWLIAEVDFTRFKATGVTAVVDEGGPVSKPDGSPPNNWQSVFAILFMVALIFVLWRTLRLMPQTKPVQLKPEARLEVRRGEQRDP